MIYSSPHEHFYPRNSACNPSEKGLMADIKNVYQVAEEMGNSPAMVKKHYFQAVTKAEAGRFWSIKLD